MTVFFYLYNRAENEICNVNFRQLILHLIIINDLQIDTIIFFTQITLFFCIIVTS